MTEDELRALVRHAIARVQGARTTNPGTTNPQTFEPANHLAHASHAMLHVTSGAEEEGPCIIEPAVPCSHCGYCKSLGH
jgi:hypothetical protein